jgi:hypothetical protein
MTQHMQPFNRFLTAATCERSRLRNISDKGAVIERFKSIIGL